MGEILSRMEGGELIALVAVGGSCLVGLTAVILALWGRVRIREMETVLKQQMLERGLSPAEIEQVVRARPASAHRSAPPRADSTWPELVTALARHGMSGEDIQRILAAFDGVSEADFTPRERAVLVLKMLRSGLDAEDIERVLLASRFRRCGLRHKRWGCGRRC
jgi:hypothetical protein